MALDRDSLYILILLCLPLQFNIFTDSWDLIIDSMITGWKEKTEITYYERYFGKKATLYTGVISAISFIFILYKVRQKRLMISILFICSAFTWLAYFAIDENKIYIAYILRTIQGIYFGCFHVICLPYMLTFVKNERKCFVGCLIQFSMFIGLLFINFLFVNLSWPTVIIIFFVMSLTFSGLIWFVPEMYVNSKACTNEHVHHKENLRLLIIMILTMILQHLSGIGILLGQLSNVLASIGINLDKYLQTCLFDFVGAIAVINSAFMADIVTTKYMWSISAFGLCIGLAVYMATLKANFADWVSSVGVFVFFLFYGLGVGPIPWYLNGTMFSENVRIETSGINMAVNVFLSPLMDFAWTKLDERFGQFGSLIFASIWDVISIFYGLFVMPQDNSDDDDNINLI